ncbi:hypothetical protein GMRT_10839 [Giardia muris]|uniref:Uncharacterized protein n=1 Tax=Giardia muris TaxID=5742 RepID=A0A4Z1SP16_GIAMU|nr:hypothetical protein GMRT_10839 [Giardia muris]|eukprot:TNJ27536.1 hypothetical protein GMRT_10839 [Giardia muris]
MKPIIYVVEVPEQRISKWQESIPTAQVPLRVKREARDPLEVPHLFDQFIGSISHPITYYSYAQSSGPQLITLTPDQLGDERLFIHMTNLHTGFQLSFPTYSYGSSLLLSLKPVVIGIGAQFAEAISMDLISYLAGLHNRVCSTPQQPTFVSSSCLLRIQELCLRIPLTEPCLLCGSQILGLPGPVHTAAGDFMSEVALAKLLGIPFTVLGTDTLESIYPSLEGLFPMRLYLFGEIGDNPPAEVPFLACPVIVQCNQLICVQSYSANEDGEGTFIASKSYNEVLETGEKLLHYVVRKTKKGVEVLVPDADDRGEVSWPKGSHLHYYPFHKHCCDLARAAFQRIDAQRATGLADEEVRNHVQNCESYEDDLISQLRGP